MPRTLNKTDPLKQLSGSLGLETQRVALVIQYLGTHFHGWQCQSAHRTVQAEIEGVLKRILEQRVVLHAAGRTDAGVHAAAQVAHFDAPKSVPAHRWADILNHRLPADIVIRASVAVPHTWHARFSALWRRYRYTIYQDRCPNLFVRHLSWHHYRGILDTDLIREALRPLLGRHHLSAFQRSGSSRSHAWVDLQDVVCTQQGSFVCIEVQASGFLYGMVRLMVGLLVEVGRGERSPAEFTALWQSERRDLVKYAAPPHGLCLLRVGYPDFPLPQSIWFDTQPSFVLPSLPEVPCAHG